MATMLCKEILIIFVVRRNEMLLINCLIIEDDFQVSTTGKRFIF